MDASLGLSSSSITSVSDPITWYMSLWHFTFSFPASKTSYSIDDTVLYNVPDGLTDGILNMRPLPSCNKITPYKMKNNTNKLSSYY